MLLAWTGDDDDNDTGPTNLESRSEVTDSNGLASAMEEVLLVLAGVTRILSSVIPSAPLTPVPSHLIFKILLATSRVFAFGANEEGEEEEEDVLTARLRRCSLAVRRRYR